MCTGIPGQFLTHDIDALRRIVRLNTVAHLDLTHHFGQRLARRGRGGVVLEQCVAEGLDALTANRSTHIPGRINRLMAAVIPRKVATRMMGRMIGQWVERKAAAAT